MEIRYATSTVIIVGELGLIIIGTDSTDSIVTNDSTRPTSSVPRTCGRITSSSTRQRGVPRLRAASTCAGSSDAIAPASSSVTNGACFHTNATTIPRQSSRLWAASGSISPDPISAWLSMPFLARNVRMIWPVTMNGMNSGHRYSQRRIATARGFSPSVR